MCAVRVVRVRKTDGISSHKLWTTQKKKVASTGGGNEVPEAVTRMPHRLPDRVNGRVCPTMRRPWNPLDRLYLTAAMGSPGLPWRSWTLGVGDTEIWDTKENE